MRPHLKKHGRCISSLSSSPNPTAQPPRPSFIKNVSFLFVICHLLFIFIIFIIIIIIFTNTKLRFAEKQSNIFLSFPLYTHVSSLSSKSFVSSVKSSSSLSLSVHLQAPAMASGSSGRGNSGSKGFDFGSDDILCSYEDYGNRDSNSNGNHADPVINANSTKV